MKKVICSQKAPGAIGPYSQAIEANGMDVRHRVSCLLMLLPERWRKARKPKPASRWRM